MDLLFPQLIGILKIECRYDQVDLKNKLWIKSIFTCDLAMNHLASFKIIIRSGWRYINKHVCHKTLIIDTRMGQNYAERQNYSESIPKAVKQNKNSFWIWCSWRTLSIKCIQKFETHQTCFTLNLWSKENITEKKNRNKN